MKFEILWILSGGCLYDNLEEIKRFSLVEYDTLERRIKISDFSRFIRTEFYDGLDEITLNAIHKEIDNGKNFLCKEIVYVNGNKILNFGYFTKIGDEYTIIEIKDENKHIYRQLKTILLMNSIL